jgi:hypothetical protein
MRAGYKKEELKPLGIWPHDGKFQMYNQYWSCCYNIDRTTIFCEQIHASAITDA